MSFEDEHAIRQAKWRVIAWKIPSGDPLCRCDECEKKQENNN
jgi:hypothetical protein